MRLFYMLLLCLVLCFVGGEAARLQREAAPEPVANPNPNPNPNPAPQLGNDDDDDDDDDESDAVDEPETTLQPLGIVSIKSRAIAMDRGLCKELSRYHPHYPKCHEYCKKLDHWIGMCRRESCHCVS